MADELGFLPVFTVTELNGHVKDIIENHFPLVRLRGELSNFKPAASGHWYFTIKDANSMISGVMFKNRSSSVRFRPSDGTEVEVAGSLSVYAARGSYQIICETMEEIGGGNLLQILEDRKRKLAAEGLFDVARKKALPLFPRSVAVITSPTGAAVRDILQVLGRRARGIDVIIVPVVVQGDSAAEKIARAIARADRDRLGDVIIVGRGGGSMEDLLPFSEEVVVRAVADCQLPIISAVGHEIDFALSDFAADLRAPTPSAAAEMVASSREELERRLFQAGNTIVQKLQGKLREVRQAIKPFSSDELERSFRNILQPSYQRLDDAKEAMIAQVEKLCLARRHRLQTARAELEACSPLDILKKGYALVRNPSTGEIILSSADLNTGDAIQIEHFDGSRRAEIS